MLKFHLQTLEVIMDTDRVDFQYQLVDGYIDYSFANRTAKEMGISESITNRAAEVEAKYQMKYKCKAANCSARL